MPEKREKRNIARTEIINYMRKICPLQIINKSI